eukprot:5241231-Alexandrium_andersonii.AAC.1
MQGCPRRAAMQSAASLVRQSARPRCRPSPGPAPQMCSAANLSCLLVRASKASLEGVTSDVQPSKLLPSPGCLSG